MILAVANQKGGVGKTISAVTLAHGAARRGIRTLLVDLDPQGNCSDSLGYEAEPGLTNWLAGGQQLSLVAQQVRPGLYLVPGDKSTATLKTSLSARGFSEYALADALDPGTLTRLGIGLVILDCAPSLDVLHTSALMAADYLLVPAKLDQFAVKGVAEIITTLAALKRRGSRCNLAGILPTFYDRQTRETQLQLENIAHSFGGQVWPPVPQDTRVRLANRKGQTLYELDPAPRALVDGYEPALTRLEELPQ